MKKSKKKYKPVGQVQKREGVSKSMNKGSRIAVIIAIIFTVWLYNKVGGVLTIVNYISPENFKAIPDSWKVVVNWSAYTSIMSLFAR